MGESVEAAMASLGGSTSRTKTTNFAALSHRVVHERKLAHNSWTAGQIARELGEYLSKVALFNPDGATPGSVAIGLELRRELIKACTSRPETPPACAAALQSISSLIELAQDKLLISEKLDDQAVQEGLSVLGHEVHLSFNLVR
ncbi:hypothetical protein [Arthrobacter sp. CAN_C5]|uniref:hypothetical protein n=1 Tax=Arthrobacter sp. CAN_C5 TaxID=2760706 RepID=UPI001AE1C28F|nr:hypothetical protein [Arthrobacter sp. CAN_C5]MBP2216798.1 hypothetical protein [Arthrobacter sp. CAN_C5]